MPRLLIAASTASLFTLLLFAWIAADVAAGPPIAFDSPVRAAVHSWSSPALTGTMRAVTHLGSDAFLIPGAAAVILLLLYYGRRRSAWIFLIVMLGAELLNQVLKLFFRRNRPEAFFNYPLPSSYSFPSGHSLMSACFFGALAAVLAPLLRSRVAQAALWASAVLLVAVIGLSRVYLGVHFPSDVIGGFAAGIAWTAGVRAVLEMRSGTPPRNRL